MAGFVTLGAVLVGIGLLGAPPGLLALLAGAVAVTAFLPRGVGAQAASNLAQRLYDRDAWHAGWSRTYLPERERGARFPGGSRRGSDIDVPPALLPDDIDESKAWLRTLASIRRLPEGGTGTHGGNV